MNESLKEDNHALIMQLDKFTKRIKQLEGDLIRDQESQKSKDQVIADLNKQLSSLFSALEDEKSDVQTSRRETDSVRKDLDSEQRRHCDTKDLLKTCEEKCTTLYQELISQNKSGVDRWTDIQRKYEDTQTLLQRQLAANEELQGKLLDYKELNSQLEREWQQKYEKLQRDRDMMVDTLKNGSERALQIVKTEYERKIAEILQQAKEDIIKVDNMRTHLQTKYDQLKAKYAKAHTTIAELKEVLQLAADADQRKDALIEEIRAGARDSKERVDRERAELGRDREAIERERREQRETQMQGKAKAEEMEYQRREMQARVESMTSKLAERGAQNESMQREYEVVKKNLRECQMELETLKDTANSVEALLRKEVDDLRAEVEDLAEIVKVKDRMLDD